MPSTINASTSAGIIQTADTSGVLALQTGGTTAITLTAAGGVAFGTSSTAYGSSGQVLTSNGNAAPTWSAPPASMIYPGAGVAVSSGSAWGTSLAAASANTANALVQRDGSGNFTAGTITAALTGNASTATTATNQSGGTVSATTIAMSGTTFTASGGSTATYGAVTVRGEKNGWSGLNFKDTAGTNCNTLMARSSDGYGGIYNKADNAWLIQWDGSGNVTATANVTAYSDERKKKNWRDLQPDFIEQLATVKHGIYDRIDEEITQVGVSAQALRPIMEHAVMENENGELSVAYGNAALVACVKLSQRVVELEAKLEQLIKDKS